MLNWDRVNVWTNTLYSLIQAVTIAKQIQFGNLSSIDQNIRQAGTWLSPTSSYASVLLNQPFGKRKITFRRDPNAHFDDIVRQLIKMLIQDLVVIFDEMMSEILQSQNRTPANYPQSKVQQLATTLNPSYQWAANGCFELIAARNVLTHGGGRWNQSSLNVIRPFVTPIPLVGDRLEIGIPMLFKYRKAIRTFLNEVM